MTLASKLAILKDRADMLGKSRDFFKNRNIQEVDCPQLNPFPCLDAYIDPIQANGGYLHTSPEYGMKRLLKEGIGDIYQLSHVFRKEEEGEKHTSEFTLVEWYRLKLSFQELIEETAEFVSLFLGPLPLQILSYREAFITYANIDPFTSDLTDEKLNIILGTEVEPNLGTSKITALIDYPATQAALAKTVHVDNHLVAKRFELYYKGTELANGYDELSNSHTQRLRFHQENQRREEIGKQKLPLDETFLQALDQLPDCRGVAVGFDRLMMLRHHKTDIREISPLLPNLTL